MESQPGMSQTSDLERELREAEEAQAEAEAAVQRAAAARAEAESAQRRAREEQEVSRRARAQSVVDAYDTDLGPLRRRFATRVIGLPKRRCAISLLPLSPTWIGSRRVCGTTPCRFGLPLSPRWSVSRQRRESG